MIVDEMDNWKLYLPHLEFVLRFLRGLDGSTPDGEYPLHDPQARAGAEGGEPAFARVFTYATRPRDLAVLETHDRYVDVQMVLAGSEYLEWHPRRGLHPEAPYDPARDATFYSPPAGTPARTFLAPGRFAILFPDDGHMTQVLVARPETVKKAVVKVPLALAAGR
jgi:YhcH/YjgK/YiaL family protein